MYTKIYQKMLFPLYEAALRKRNTLPYLKELERTQWLSEEELKQMQWNKLKALLAHAYENVPFYKDRFANVGLHPDNIKTPDDFDKIPYLTKDDIRNNHDNLLAVNYKGKKIGKQVTGGSTGTPLHFMLDDSNYRWRTAAVKRVYGWTGYADGKKTVFIWGAPVVKQPILKKLKHDLDEVLKRHKIFNTFHLKESMMASYIDEINAYKPEHIVAYTTPLYNFARFIKENKKRIASPISIIAAAEKVYPSQRKIIEEVFDAPLFETYGCREVTSIAGECWHHKGMHINMETIYLEIIKEDRPADKGETGEIIITDLTNYAMPFIRYKNEDLGSFSETNCACGRGLEMLKEVEGRVLDTIKTIDGRLIPGEFFIYWFMSFEDIRQFQVVQDDLRHLHIKIIQEKSFSNNRLDELKRVICEIMGTEISITFEIVDEIPLTPSGKFRVVVSKVPINFSSQPAEVYTA